MTTMTEPQRLSLKMFKENIVNSLREKVLKLKFIKADGTERTMICTLREDLIAPYVKAAEERKKQLLAEGKTVRTKKESVEVISVIDLEKKEWRSFRTDSFRWSVPLNDYKEYV